MNIYRILNFDQDLYDLISILSGILNLQIPTLIEKCKNVFFKTNNEKIRDLYELVVEKEMNEYKSQLIKSNNEILKRTMEDLSIQSQKIMKFLE